MHKITKNTAIYSMSATNAPVLTIQPGERVIFETHDCFGGQITTPGGFTGIDWSRINPATGPLYIEGAQAGDVLIVHIEDIAVNDTGIVAVSRSVKPLGHLVMDNELKIVTIRGGKAIFDDITLPLNKMVGVIGTAPVGGAAILCGEPGEHGGNMDCKRVAVGAAVYLPVNVDGALLAMGDIHAVMADGEIGATGLEVGGEITVRIELMKGNKKNVPLPVIMNDTHVMSVASDVDLDEACNKAVENMAAYMTTHGFGINEAAMLISLAGDVRICQVVNPKKTVRVEMPKSILAARR